jgi:predicted component of type VI protein secretion system
LVAKGEYPRPEKRRRRRRTIKINVECGKLEKKIDQPLETDKLSDLVKTPQIESAKVLSPK